MIDLVIFDFQSLPVSYTDLIRYYVPMFEKRTALVAYNFNLLCFESRFYSSIDCILAFERLSKET